MSALLTKLVLLAIAVGLIHEAVKYWRRVKTAGRSRGWPCVEGRIERSETFLKVARSYRGSRTRSGIYIPLVHYTYAVRGRERRGDVITFGREPIYSSWPGRAEEKCREYRLGSTARVFYDPEDPSVSCLERGAGSLTLGYVVAVLLAGLAVLPLMGIVLR